MIKVNSNSRTLKFDDIFRFQNFISDRLHTVQKPIFDSPLRGEEKKPSRENKKKLAQC